MDKTNIPLLIEYLNSDDAQNFLLENLEKDVNKLYLNFGSNENTRAIIDQIFIRQKLRKKNPLWYANSKLIFTKNISHEQSSSEATASLKSKLISGVKLIDLTGGMGVDTYFLSKSFDSCIYTEKQSELAKYTEHNFKILGADNIEVINADSLDKIIDQKSDWVYIDPARRDSHNSKLVSLRDCEPNVLEIKEKLTSKGRNTLIKASPMLDIPLAIKELENVFEVWVISHRNETKEIVFHLKEGNHNPLLRTFNILVNGGLENFDFYMNEADKPSIASTYGNYLYEPNSSLQKARGGDSFAAKHGLKKLDSNTNLYFSESLVEKFPGKIFKVNQVLKPYDKSLKKGRFNVVSRNFPDKADHIQKKLGIKSSKAEYLIACKTSFTQYVFIQASQIPI